MGFPKDFVAIRFRDCNGNAEDCVGVLVEISRCFYNRLGDRVVVPSQQEPYNSGSILAPLIFGNSFLTANISGKPKRHGAYRRTCESDVHPKRRTPIRHIHRSSYGDCKMLGTARICKGFVRLS